MQREFDLTVAVTSLGVSVGGMARVKVERPDLFMRRPINGQPGAPAAPEPAKAA